MVTFTIMKIIVMIGITLIEIALIYDCYDFLTVTIGIPKKNLPLFHDVERQISLDGAAMFSYNFP